MPCQIVIKVFASHTSIASKEALKTLVIRIHVLDVIDLLCYVSLLPWIIFFMSKPLVPTILPKCLFFIRTENDIWSKPISDDRISLRNVWMCRAMVMDSLSAFFIIHLRHDVVEIMPGSLQQDIGHSRHQIEVVLGALQRSVAHALAQVHEFRKELEAFADPLVDVFYGVVVAQLVRRGMRCVVLVPKLAKMVYHPFVRNEPFEEGKKYFRLGCSAWIATLYRASRSSMVSCRAT